MVGVFVAFVRVVYGRTIYMSLPLSVLVLVHTASKPPDEASVCNTKGLLKSVSLQSIGLHPISIE